jgi:hypothetical protein
MGAIGGRCAFPSLADEPIHLAIGSEGGRGVARFVGQAADQQRPADRVVLDRSGLDQSRAEPALALQRERAQISEVRRRHAPSRRFVEQGREPVEPVAAFQQLAALDERRDEARLKRQRVAIGRVGFVEPGKARKRPAALHVDVGAQRGEPGGAVERRKRFAMAAEMAQRPRKLDQAGGIVRRQPHRPGELARSLLELSRLGQGDAEIVADRGEVGADQAGLGQRLDRAGAVAGGAAGIAEIVPDLPIAGVARHHLLVAGDRLGEAALSLQLIALEAQFPAHRIS